LGGFDNAAVLNSNFLVATELVETDSDSDYAVLDGGNLA
jgi:hypothetical protein